MGAALVARTGAGSSDSNNVTTSSVNTTGANFLVALVGWYSGGPPTLSDSKSNLGWTGLNVYSPANDTNVKIQIFYCPSATVGSGHTFKVSSSGLQPSVAVLAFSGVDASPFDQQNGSNASNFGTTIQTGSVTPTTDNQVVIACYDGYSGDVSSIDSSFTLTDHGPYAGHSVAFGIAYLIQTSATAVNPTFTLGASNVNAAAIATFKASAGGGGGSVPSTYYNYLLASAA
jgi:hypothetical protein